MALELETTPVLGEVISETKRAIVVRVPGRMPF
jgi:hypothetical protein